MGKTAGRDFWLHLRSCMKHLGFQSCLADPDVWMREGEKPSGEKYWEFVLLYTDDCLCISHKGESVLRNEIGKYFKLKEKSIGPHSQYLGEKLRKVQLQNGAYAWAFGCSQYVQEAVRNVEKYLNERKRSLLPSKKAQGPMENNYRPELQTSPELSSAEAAYFMSFIGILRWMVELGRIDICCEVSMLSSYLALPREGHLDQIFHIFAYLKYHHNTELVFDPSIPEISGQDFEKQNWEGTIYGDDLVEEKPPNRPKSRGNGMRMTVYVDSDHAGDSVTRRSRTGFIV